MTTEYIVWIQIEECEMDGDDCDTITNMGEPRQAGHFKTELLAYEHVQSLLDQTASASRPPATGRAGEGPGGRS